MATEPGSDLPAGRPIRLTPMAPGVWLVILGSGVATLAPLFGFLIGTILGNERETLGMSPIFLFLFLGFLVGGIGIGIALLGVRRILRARAESTASTPR